MGLHFAQDIFPLPDLRPPTGSYMTIVGVSCERLQVGLCCDRD